MASAGALIAASSIAGKYVPGFAYIPGFAAGLGLLLFGIGAWMDHPRKKKKETVDGLRGFDVVDDWPWEPTPLGIAFNVTGAAVFVFGLYQVAFAP